MGLTTTFTIETGHTFFKQGEISLTILSDLEKEKLKIFGDEYKTLVKGISQRVDFQQKLLNFHLIFLAITATLIGKNPSFIFSVDALPFLLIIPIILMFFVWSHTNHDAMIIAYAEFINGELKPKIEKLLQGEKVFEFEQFLKKYRRNRYSILTILGGEYNLAILIAVISLIWSIILLYKNYPISLSYIKNINVSYTVITAIIIEIILLSWTILLRVKTGFSYININITSARLIEKP